MKNLGRLIVACLVGLAGCNGYKIKQSLEKHRDAGKAKLAALNQLAINVETQPAVTAVEWKLPVGVKLDFQYMINGDDFKQPTRDVNPKYNAAMVHAAYLRTPCQAEWTRWGDSRSAELFIMTIDHSSDWLEDPACYLDTNAGKFGSEIVDDPKYVTEKLESLIATKYVVALRWRKFVSPSINLAAGTSTTKSFNRGLVDGDAVVFDIASGEYVGGFPIHVESPDTVELKKYDGGKELQLKLSQSVGEHISKQLRAVGNFPYN